MWALVFWSTLIVWALWTIGQCRMRRDPRRVTMHMGLREVTRERAPHETATLIIGGQQTRVEHMGQMATLLTGGDMVAWAPDGAELRQDMSGNVWINGNPVLRTMHFQAPLQGPTTVPPYTPATLPGPAPFAPVPGSAAALHNPVLAAAQARRDAQMAQLQRMSDELAKTSRDVAQTLANAHAQ